MPGDLDSKRPAGISSTDEEHDAAIAKAYEVRGRLIELGWPENAFVLADSGNGAHLDTKIDLQNVPEDVALVRRCLEAMRLPFFQMRRSTWTQQRRTLPESGRFAAPWPGRAIVSRKGHIAYPGS
ncbi:hypothetical protein [Methanothrix soehngenii]|uniref:hypothetical protein n=1 Tax=Methanothrix soehngenii TaxID=2223 RepID=UPI00300C3B92